MLAGASDEEILERCYANGRRPGDGEIEIFNGFMQNAGWRDASSEPLAILLQRSGLGHLDHRCATRFDFIKFDEGRTPPDFRSLGEGGFGCGLRRETSTSSAESLSRTQREEGQFPPPPALERFPPPLDSATHQKIASAINARMRETTKKLYGDFFQQLFLSADLQEKVIDVLTQQQKELEQQTFEAAQAGRLLTLPSPEEVREQQAQQNQQLLSVLGDAGFTAFRDYQASIPGRIILNDMNQQGANLSESQSAQFLQILTQARQQIIDRAGVTQNLDSMPPEQANTVIQQQDVLLQQTVRNRIQSLLSPQQTKVLQGIFSQRSMSPNGQ